MAKHCLVVHAAWVRANTLCLARAEVGCGVVLIAPDIHFILRGHWQQD
jgi:hypothetical protein